MKWINRIAYGVGQMLKDLVGSTIIAFSIIFYEGCLGIPKSSVGLIFLSGQVVNALVTPLIGFLSDRTPSFGSKIHTCLPDKSEVLFDTKPTIWTRLKLQLALGKRKSWHLAGSLLMLIAFPCIFWQPESTVYLPLWAKCLINSLLYIIVQIGWAAVQIPHLSIINDLASSLDERVILASLRYFFGSIADISMFILSYIFFYKEQLNKPDKTRLPSNQTVDLNENVSINTTNISTTADFKQTQITIRDMPFFRDISLLIAGLGAVFVIIFHVGVREKTTGTVNATTNDSDQSSMTKENLDFYESEKTKQVGNSKINNQSKAPEPKFALRSKSQLSVAVTPLKWYDWFKQLRFWVGCSIFTTTRLSTIVAMMYINPFLLSTLGMEKSLIVSVPLVFSICSLLTTLIQQKASHYLGNFLNSLVGVCLILAFCSLVFFLQPDVNNQVLVHLAAVLLGAGATINNVRAVTVIANLIGNSQVSTAAFVHGVASFTEKLCTGLVIQIIQACLPVLTYRHVEVFVVGGLVTLGGILSTVSRYLDKRTMNKLEREADHFEQEESHSEDAETNVTTITTVVTDMGNEISSDRRKLSFHLPVIQHQ